MGKRLFWMPVGYSSYLWSNGSEDPLFPSLRAALISSPLPTPCGAMIRLGVRLQPLPEVILPDTLILCEDGELTLDAGAGYYTYSRYR